MFGSAISIYIGGKLMGNNAILSVLGLMVFFGIINTTLNTKNVQSSENIATYVNTDAAREKMRMMV